MRRDRTGEILGREVFERGEAVQAARHEDDQQSAEHRERYVDLRLLDFFREAIASTKPISGPQPGSPKP